MSRLVLGPEPHELEVRIIRNTFTPLVMNLAVTEGSDAPVWADITLAIVAAPRAIEWESANTSIASDGLSATYEWALSSADTDVEWASTQAVLEYRLVGEATQIVASGVIEVFG